LFSFGKCSNIWKVQTWELFRLNSSYVKKIKLGKCSNLKKDGNRELFISLKRLNKQTDRVQKKGLNLKYLTVDSIGAVLSLKINTICILKIMFLFSIVDSTGALLFFFGMKGVHMFSIVLSKFYIVLLCFRFFSSIHYTSFVPMKKSVKILALRLRRATYKY
jgi:hypothetical protein